MNDNRIDSSSTAPAAPPNAAPEQPPETDMTTPHHTHETRPQGVPTGMTTTKRGVPLESDGRATRWSGWLVSGRGIALGGFGQSVAECCP